MCSGIWDGMLGIESLSTTCKAAPYMLHYFSSLGCFFFLSILKGKYITPSVVIYILSMAWFVL